MPIIEPIIEGNSMPKREIKYDGTTKAIPDQMAKGRLCLKRVKRFGTDDNKTQSIKIGTIKPIKL